MTHVRSSIRIVWMTHVRTSPYYPQSNGKIERWHGTLKRECIRPGVLLNLDDAKSVVGDYIHHYNNVRLNSAIGYIAPIDKLNGRSEEIFRARDLKLELARQTRKKKRSGKIRRNNPLHQGPMSSDEHAVGAHSRNRALTELPSEVVSGEGAMKSEGQPTNSGNRILQFQ